MVVPSVSVVIPAYRAESTIARAIDSVLAQTSPASEIIVVDDGSPDHQVDVVQKYGQAVTLIRQPNRKTAIARNTGIEHASGEFVAFLDADDYWEPEKLQRQLAVFSQHREVGVVGGRFYLQPTAGPRETNQTNKSSWYDRVIHATGPTAFMLGTMLWTGTVMVRRKLLEKEQFLSCLEPAEDRDLWIRLASTVPVYLISQPLATAVLTEGGISRSNIAHDCGRMLDVVDRHQQTLGLFPALLWRSYVRYRWASMEQAPRIALPLLMQSLIGWPAPFVGMPKMQSWGRLRRLIILVDKLCRRPRAVHVTRAT